MKNQFGKVCKKNPISPYVKSDKFSKRSIAIRQTIRIAPECKLWRVLSTHTLLASLRAPNSLAINENKNKTRRYRAIEFESEKQKVSNSTSGKEKRGTDNLSEQIKGRAILLFYCFVFVFVRKLCVLCRLCVCESRIAFKRKNFPHRPAHIRVKMRGMHLCAYREIRNVDINRQSNCRP